MAGVSESNTPLEVLAQVAHAANGRDPVSCMALYVLYDALHLDSMPNILVPI